MGDLKRRALSALVLGPLVLIIFVFLPPQPFLFFMAAVLAVAVHELASMAGLRSRLLIAALAVVVLIPLYAGRPDTYVLCVFFSPALYLVFRLLTPRSQNGSVIGEIGTTATVLVISQFFLALALFSLYRLKEIDRYLPLMLLLTIWASDTAAYLVGKNMGRHKLAPHISPKKTVEGLLGAVAGSLLITLFFSNRLGLTLLPAIVVGLFIGILGQLGDMLESIAKRVWNVKDSSSLIPGHGGILDRLDSFLLTAPFMYYYLSGFRG